jgi:3,4-dihydroxy 2-butanone 4-phosphate synthase/GTP cyclohydrolase II
VICEIMNEDGTMARMDDLVSFAQFHNLKIGTIRDLIAYRRRHDHLVEKRAETRFTSDWGGEWSAITFWNKATGSEQVALVKGKVDPDKPTLVRMHALSPFADIFGEGGPRGGLLRRSMELIAAEGAGVVVVINRPRPDQFTVALQARAGALKPGDMDELRDYGVGATILTELGVRDMVLLTNTHHTLVGLDGYGLSIVGERSIPGA